MDIQDRQVNGIAILTLKGDIDALSAPEITEYINGMVAKGNIKLVVDLSGVGYTSSAGLRLLLGAVKETRMQGGDLRLAAVQPDVLKVLSLSGFTNILKIFDGVDSALASF
jgi:anti-anti-sigma factor